MFRPVPVVVLAFSTMTWWAVHPAAAYVIGDPSQPPEITITSIPAPCTPGSGGIVGTLYGIANNVDTDVVDIVFYARTDKFYPQPVTGMGAHTPIQPDGTFSRSTYCGEVYYALLVKKSWYPLSSFYYLPTLSSDIRAIACNPNRRYTLSGWDWWGKGTDGATFNPGGNYWSDDTLHLWASADGIHMKLDSTAGKWRSPEFYSKTAFPYGRIQFAVTGPICALDPRVVFGGFIYLTTVEEADIEMALWGNANNPYNAQYIVQPDGPGRKYRFHCPPLNQTNHEMVWESDRITFASREGGAPGYGNIIATWSFTGTGIPQESDSMRCHFNLWTLDSTGPSNHLPVEVTVTAFSFTPLALVSVPAPVVNPVVVLRNAPNPVRDRMHLTFNLPTDEAITLDVYDVQGRLVSNIANRQWHNAGVNRIDVDAPSAAGVYLLRLVAGNHVALCKVSVVR